MIEVLIAAKVSPNGFHRRVVVIYEDNYVGTSMVLFNVVLHVTNLEHDRLNGREHGEGHEQQPTRLTEIALVNHRVS